MATVYHYAGEPKKRTARKKPVRVLILEPCRLWRKSFSKELPHRKKIRVYMTDQAVKAERAMALTQDFDFIVIGEESFAQISDSTKNFVETARANFKGQIIACCSNCNNGAVLMKSGCNCQIQKSGLVKKILEYSQEQFSA